MSTQRMISSLQGLVAVRQTELDRLTTELAKKEAVRQRYRANLSMLRRMFDDIGVDSRTEAPSLALNGAAYRQALAATMAAHEQALTLHEADLAASRQVVLAKAVKREMWSHELERRRSEVRSEAERQAQRQQDDLAVQAWRRGGPWQ